MAKRHLFLKIQVPVKWATVVAVSLIGVRLHSSIANSPRTRHLMPEVASTITTAAQLTLPTLSFLPTSLAAKGEAFQTAGRLSSQTPYLRQIQLSREGGS